MPGVGKSTIGVVLAKVLGYQFVDADLVIQEKEGKLLREIIAEEGPDGFIAVENRINSEIEAHHSVIATGGSVVYGKEAMEHYYKAQETKNIADFLEAVSFESEMYLNILFDYYEQSVLLFCRSDGSLVGKKLNQIIEDKVESTVIYVADYLTNEVDPNAVRLLMNAGFSTYRSLLETVKAKKEAKKVMKEVGDFFNAGWKALFEKYM